MSFCLHCMGFDLGSELFHNYIRVESGINYLHVGKGEYAFTGLRTSAGQIPFGGTVNDFPITPFPHAYSPYKWTIENIVIKTAIAHHVFKGRVACIVGGLGRFKQHVCPIAITVHILVFFGSSTRLGNRTEKSVVRGAIARHVFKGRFDCVGGCFRPFSTASMLNTPHCSHTHASWVNQPVYAIGP